MNKKILASAILGSLSLVAAQSALAGAVIYNTGDADTATLALGVKDSGGLNTSPNITSNAGATGLAYKFPDGTWRDATAPGCLCEGWGVSATSGATGFSGWDGNGSANLSFGAVSATASTATTVANVTTLPGLSVKHVYAPAGSSLFRSTVTITNDTGGTLTDVRYVRVMDWDVPPTEFSEFVTIKGTATTTLLELSHDDGFESANPLASTSAILPGTTNVDFTDSGPADHGAYFKFNFGELLAGASYTFDIFYGATASERTALAAIGAAGIELYSLGQQRGDPTGGTPATYIFGFKGVGGVPVEPPGVPIPGTLALLGLGLTGLGFVRRRKA
jgi:type IV pilus assembly protein PilY1